MDIMVSLFLLGIVKRMGECIVNYINFPDERKLEMNRNAFKTAQLYQADVVTKKTYSTVNAMHCSGVKLSDYVVNRTILQMEN